VALRAAALRALVVALAALLAVVALPPAGTAEPAPPYVPPVDAPVVDPFRPPATRWAPGNRGLEYGTEPGTVVRAVGEGTVVFAGTVAGTHHVTVQHPDGVRTSYSFLDEVRVVVGQRVAQGHPLGTTAGNLHLGARVGDEYFDPALLFEVGPPTVHLVPFDLPPSLWGGERSALSQLIGGTVGFLVEGVGAAGEWALAQPGRLVDALGHYVVAPGWRVLGALYDGTRAALDAYLDDCTDADAPVAPPSERRIAITVAGLGSTSDHGAIDDLALSAHGYDADDVARFSYGGGTTPSRGRTFADVAGTTYGQDDTTRDIRASGSALADLIEAAAAAAPGAPIDLYAHSQGGLVTRVALLELEDRHGAGWLERLGVVLTFGTPHDGADLATAARALQVTSAGSLLLDGVDRVLGYDLDAPSLQQLAEGSDLIEELAERGVPPGVEMRSIAARTDIVVPVPRTRVDGVEHVVVPVDGLTAHDALPGSDEAAREVALALADLPPACQSLVTHLSGEIGGRLISAAEDELARLALPPLLLTGISPG